MRKNLPTKITPCPIAEAVVEICFKTNTNPNVIFGLIYSKINEFYDNIEELPILQIPEFMRSQDAQFQYKPYYKLINRSKPNILLQVGPNVLSISTVDEYVGWEALLEEIQIILKVIKSLDIIDTVVRVGLRYINFFEFNIFEQSNMQLKLNNKNVSYENTMIRNTFVQDEFINTLQIGCNIEINNNKGSVIDIDTSCMTNLEGFLDNSHEILNKGHLIEKELFFTLLNKDYINKLEPKY